jgi:predicted alpha/beta-hydrolase family hydrolase
VTGRAPVLVLAPGAGAGHQHPFLVTLGRAFAARGVHVVTFNFPYVEAGRKRPDPLPLLEAAWRDAIAAVAAHEELGSARLFIGGKSMGGRVATHVAAQPGALARVPEGVVCFGYPLKPPYRGTARGVDHLAAIACPVLILQGTRDPFGGPDDVRRAASEAGAAPEVVPVEGADHGFALPRAAGRGSAQVLDSLASDVVAWMARAS